MREIKFRQWLSLRNYMHYGIGVIEEGNWAGPVSCVFNQDPIMQFTGLFDKNGKEIYEGDVVSSIFAKGIENYEAELIGVVVYRDCYFTIDRKKNNGHIPWVDWPTEYFENCEVIGNVWENSELLEETK